MISHKHKCIFVEVPKTGSTSIRGIIGNPVKQHLNICQIRHDLQNHYTHYRGNKNKIISCLYSFLPKEKRFENGEKIFSEYFKFGFVRNPWDRVVSLYLRKEGLQLKDKMSFDEFVRWIKYSSSTCNQPMPHTNQLDWLVDPHGEVLVDFIGKFEKLQEDWSTIAKKLNLESELPHKNKNPRRKKHYTEFYTDELVRIIGEKFKVDIEYFGYEFEG